MVVAIRYNAIDIRDYASIVSDFIERLDQNHFMNHILEYRLKGDSIELLLLIPDRRVYIKGSLQSIFHKSAEGIENREIIIPTLFKAIYDVHEDGIKRFDVIVRRHDVFADVGEVDTQRKNSTNGKRDTEKHLSLLIGDLRSGPILSIIIGIDIDSVKILRHMDHVMDKILCDDGTD